MSETADRRHDAFDNPAKRACRSGNLRVLREAAYRHRERFVTIVEGRRAAVSEAVHEILGRIEQLPPAERLELEEVLAQQAEAEWQHEAEEARRLALHKGIDQAVIDRAVEKVRYGA